MNLNYGFGEDQVNKTTSQFPVACDVNNVEITNAQYVSGTSQSGTFWEAIDFTYSRGGAMLNDRIFAINPDNVHVRSFIPDDTYEQALADKVKIFNTQLKHIATKLNITDEQLKVCNMSTFETMAKDYCNLINSKSTGVKLFMKTISSGGYPKVARDPNNSVPFLQRMDSNGGICELAYTSKEMKKMLQEKAPKNGVMSGQGSEAWVPSTDNV